MFPGNYSAHHSPPRRFRHDELPGDGEKGDTEEGDECNAQD